MTVGSERLPPAGSNRDRSNAPLVVAVLTGFLALMATLGAAVVKGIYDTKLERQRFQSELVLRAIQSTSFPERVASLRFMVAAKLITDPRIAEAVDSLVKRSSVDSMAVPQIAAIGASFPSPSVENARIFLLTGVQKSVSVLDTLRADLARAGYAVAGTRVIRNDESRPDHPEVTFFNASDSTQAQAIARILRVRLNAPQLVAQRRGDPTAKSGYLEIWLGKQ